ncbi:MAG TPA: SCO family protein [Chloroflexota bacterium]|nr:SCO family protein [Chloroflexota bacterium]
MARLGAIPLRVLVLGLVVWIAALAVFGIIYRSRVAAPAAATSGYPWFTGVTWMRQANNWLAPPFTLPDHRDQLVSLAQFRGRVALVSFTSSVCKSQCPLIGRALGVTERDLGPLAGKTVLVNISVEPEVDTNKTVSRFAREMGWTPYHWYYLWGPRSEMKPVWSDYGVYVQNPKTIKPGQDVQHLAAVALVDQSGHLRGFLSWPFRPSRLARGIRDLIQGKV